LVPPANGFRATFTRDDNWGNKGDRRDRTQFDGMSNKNNDDIAQGESVWKWNGTGKGPQKNDITNSYFHTRRDGDDLWVFLGAETRATNGDSHVDFEFNQAGVFICPEDPTDVLADCVNDTSVESFLASNSDGVIIGLGDAAGRTVGDFVISIDFVQGGATPVANFRQWVETAPGEFEFMQFDSDCEVLVTATNMGPVTHPKFTGTVQTGWDHFEGDGTPTETITELQFVEVGFCLNCMASEEIDVCATNSTFQVKTRSSQSFTAELKDLVLVPFPLEPTPECEISGPELVCPKQTNITYRVAETTGDVVSPTFEWVIMGDATFCGGATMTTGESVCVDTIATAPCPSSFELWVTVISEFDCINTCHLIVDIDDTRPPTITCPADFSVQCPEDVPACDPNDATASDNCDPNPTITCSQGPLVGGICGGTVTNTYTATDDCGNTDTCTQVITVDDTMAPTITCPSDVEIACGQEYCFTVLADDNCDQTPTIRCSFSDNADPDRFSVRDLGNGMFCVTISDTAVVTVMCSAEDDCGNVSDTCSFTITAICDLECRVTGGGVDTFGNWDGTWCEGSQSEDRYTFGGQAGAPTASSPGPFGEWTHHQQRGDSGRFVFHAGTSSAPPGTEIANVECSDPGFCNPARQAPAKQIDFDGVGSFKNISGNASVGDYAEAGETLHWFSVHIEDLGEPGMGGKVDPPEADCPPEGSSGSVADCDCPDYYEILIHETTDPGSMVIYEVRGYITGGNLQIHPPVGS
jgi:hypothetical protein